MEKLQRKNQKVGQIWVQEGKSYAKAISLDKRGGVRLALGSFFSRLRAVARSWGRYCSFWLDLALTMRAVWTEVTKMPDKTDKRQH